MIDTILRCALVVDATAIIVAAAVIVVDDDALTVSSIADTFLPYFFQIFCNVYLYAIHTFLYIHKQHFVSQYYFFLI